MENGFFLSLRFFVFFCRGRFNGYREVFINRGFMIVG